MTYDAPLTSPVEAGFRRESAANAVAALPVPDLVHSPPRRATFPRRRPERPAVSESTFTLPGYGGVSMLRSISQPVLTVVEHAQYTASRAESLGRATGRQLNRASSSRSARSRPSLADLGGDSDVEMDDDQPQPRIDRLATAPSIAHYVDSQASQHAYDPHTPAEVSHPSFSPWSSFSSPGDLPRRRTPSPTPSSTHPDRYIRRTPSPVSTSRLAPTGRVRVRPRDGSPPPSTSARAAAWRMRGSRCLPWFEVHEAVGL